MAILELMELNFLQIFLHHHYHCYQLIVFTVVLMEFILGRHYLFLRQVKKSKTLTKLFNQLLL
ncbi:MAG: hypothetical protein EBR47_05710 [Betaproteobacteria bacterium]|nr:hypothetical protein [Betaproteobacteria bacterium]